MPETIPDQTTNAGPDYHSATEDMDWRDHLWVAEEYCKAARNMEQTNSSMDARSRNRNRIKAIEDAIEELQSAKELLCR